MKHNNILRAAVMALTLCATPTWAAAGEPIKIGVIAATTGGGAPWGLAAVQAVKIKANEVNAEGGLQVNGERHKVEVIAYDDKYRAADAVSAYNRLVRQDGAKFVYIMGSAGTLAVKNQVEDDQVIGLTTSFSAKAIDANTKFMYRVFSVSANYIPSLIDWLKENYKERRVFLANPNDETGWDQDQLTSRLFAEKGYDLVGRDLYERNQKDFQPLFTKIMATNPEIIDLGSTSPATAGIMIRQARDIGFKGRFLKTGGSGPRDIIAGAGKEAAEGMISTLYADPNNAGYRHLADEYKKVYGQEPNEILISYYDATSILMRAIQKAGDINDTTKMAQSFASVLPMDSAQGGSITLGGKQMWGVDNQFITPMYIAAIRDGEAVVVGKAK
ncbi:ABC transporter substrate-binding protein [Advenella mimigardefordensis]|uniref:Putative branched-chain amino acid-binding protein n=1 Tax=Advenella mimigardefordensis (strain DSM 17166 / LMG 22922 / DPN7) TaxID=1247726 RepID=W0PDE1_ADVMD|nr:ABC transporter substrate-binding protein [Advenella mimigardefordensis]AHG63482.1 putative branched-chain amino acid-binding protein [Advenella mimigardefordensis DPN7]